MREDIQPYLDNLEEELDISIVGAWDTGSRARGLQSEGSDYDVSICFTQPKKNYIIGDDYIESFDDDASEFIQEPEDTDIPISLVEVAGWDIKRFFDLLLEYKQTAIDCLVSSVRYKQHPAFNACSDYCTDNIHPIELFTHFQSAVDYNYETYISSGDDVTVKRNLFIVESILRARFVEHTHEYPPMNFFVLLNTAPDEVFNDISRVEAERLANKKTAGDGSEEIGNPYEEQIESFINYELDYEEHIPDSHITSSGLNEYIRLILQN